MSVKSFLRQLLPNTIQAHYIWNGPLRRNRIVTSWHDYPAAILGYTERSLLDWFTANVKPGETWLDIGAHYGYTAIALCRLVGERGRVFAFEPMLSTAGYLTQTRLLNQFTQLTVVPMGLGVPDTVMMTRLPIVRGMVDSTIQKANAWEETLLVARMDWLWQQICNDNPSVDGVKIDVQGMEIQVLRGMTSILAQRHPKLIVEVHRGVDRGELLALVERVGYSRDAVPIEPIVGETRAQFVDDKSYAFSPSC